MVLQSYSSQQALKTLVLTSTASSATVGQFISAQVLHPEAKPDLPTGPLPKHLAQSVLVGQLWREAVSGDLHIHKSKHLLI